MFKDNHVHVRFERWGEIEREVISLARSHFLEVEGPLAALRPLQLKIPTFRQLDSTGSFRVITARSDSRLVGYCSWILQEDIESAGNLMATQGAMYVSSDLRSGATVYHMIQLAIKTFRRLGVKYIFIHHRLLGRGVRLALWFQRLKATPIKHEYFLWIGDGD